MKYEIFKKLFYIDESSPSGLRWNIDVFSGKNNSKLEKRKGDQAGTISKNGRNFYWKVHFSYEGLKNCTTAHIVILTLRFGVDALKDKNVDHIDGEGLNNKEYNLRVVEKGINRRNCKKYITNKSGETGVYLMVAGERNYWMCYWRHNKKSYSKCFRFNPENKESECLAKNKAISYRKEKLRILDEGYTERHGK